jgi:hypothetical protein
MMGNMVRSHESRKKVPSVGAILGSTESQSSSSARPPLSSTLCHHPPPLQSLDNNISGCSPGSQSLPPCVSRVRPLACQDGSSSTTVRPCQNSQVTTDQTNPRDNQMSTLLIYCKQHINHTTNNKISRSPLFAGNNPVIAGSLYS